jgi:transcriptional regulator with XRE-family HTH domain
MAKRRALEAAEQPREQNGDPISFDLHQLSRLMKEERLRRHLTLEEVSAETGVDVSTLSRIENNTAYNPRAANFLRMLRWLRMDQEQFTPPQADKDVDTMTKVSLVLKNDPTLPSEVAEELIRSWRSMYEFYSARAK